MRNLLIVSAAEVENKISRTLARSDWEPLVATGRDEARELADRHRPLVGLAVFPRSRDGELIEEIEKTLDDLPRLKWVAALSREQIEHDEVRSFIVENLYDYQIYPISGQRLSVVLGHAYGMAMLEQELRERVEPVSVGELGMIGASAPMRELYRTMRRAAHSDVPVLIQGATGTGKEKVARAIHDSSARAGGPFVALNCAAIPPSLMQSELFGYEKGAFTHAFERKNGHIEEAAGGTLLLDEIGEMPLESQASLLRFLEEKTVTPLGGTKTVPVDVRVIASTNRDLHQCVRDKAFRADLFYRLAVLIVRTPLLSERGGDLKLLAEHFLAEALDATDAAVLGFRRDALEALTRYDWPGNLREMRSRILQATIRCEGRYITPLDLQLPADALANNVLSLQQAREEAEKRTLETTLSRNRWNLSRAAKDLRISRMTLYRLLEKHDIHRDR